MSAKRPDSNSTEQPPIAAPRLLHSVPRVAHLLDCSKATVWRMIAAKQLPVIHVGPNGGLTRVPDAALQALLQSRAA